MFALLALGASLVWGLSDFAAGLLARRTPAAQVVAVTHVLGALGLTALVLLTGGAGDDGHPWLPWAVVSGLAGGLGLLALYAALADGTMGVVAPISSLAAVVPVVWGLLRGDEPGWLSMVGIAIAILGVVLASGPELSSGTRLRPVALAVLAAALLGVSFVATDGGSEHSVLRTLWAARIASAGAAGVVVLVLLLARHRSEGAARPFGGQPSGARTDRRMWWGLLFVAVADPVATGLYGLASATGLVSVAAVLSSLFPIVTVICARLVLDERLRTVQLAGVALSVAGVVLIAGG